MKISQVCVRTGNCIECTSFLLAYLWRKLRACFRRGTYRPTDTSRTVALDSFVRISSYLALFVVLMYILVSQVLAAVGAVACGVWYVVCTSKG